MIRRDEAQEELERLTEQLDETLEALQQKIIKLHYGEKSPRTHLIMQELAEDYKEHLSRYIVELELLNAQYSERYTEMTKDEEKP